MLCPSVLPWDPPAVAVIMAAPIAGLSSKIMSESSASPQPQAVSQVTNTTGIASESKPKKKICCACPDTKRLRDECVVEHGEAACTKWIEAHCRCLRAEGFNV